LRENEDVVMKKLYSKERKARGRGIEINEKKLNTGESAIERCRINLIENNNTNELILDRRKILAV